MLSDSLADLRAEVAILAGINAYERENNLNNSVGATIADIRSHVLGDLQMVGLANGGFRILINLGDFWSIFN